MTRRRSLILLIMLPLSLLLGGCGVDASPFVDPGGRVSSMQETGEMLGTSIAPSGLGLLPDLLRLNNRANLSGIDDFVPRGAAVGSLPQTTKWILNADGTLIRREP
ncbi:MAG: hypothetical protein ACOC93_02705 [Planctomycetota bacterium]